MSTSSFHFFIPGPQRSSAGVVQIPGTPDDGNTSNLGNIPETPDSKSEVRFPQSRLDSRSWIASDYPGENRSKHERILDWSIMIVINVFSSTPSSLNS